MLLPEQVIVEQGQVLDGALLLPALSHTIDTQPSDTGVFLFQCDVQVTDATPVTFRHDRLCARWVGPFYTPSIPKL